MRVELATMATGLGLCAAAGMAVPPPMPVTKTVSAPGVVTEHVASDVAPTGGGSPLRLEYSCEDLMNGLYYYEFELIVDNNDGTYVPGQGWGWVIFGDQQQMDSNLTNFMGDQASLPAGPFTQFQGSGGFHNGPTLGPVVIDDGNGGFINNIWTPEGVGDSISWAGWSDAQLGDGELLFSTLMLDGGAVAANFQQGVKVGGGDDCPADCNGDGELSVLDFVCFQGEWQNQTAAGDCNGDGQYSILDFVCYQGQFQQGCP